MKIAAVTDDELTISQHFGRSRFFLVVTIEDGQITHRELRDKLGHAQFVNLPHDDHDHDHDHEHGHGHGQRHGLDAASHGKHLRMTEAITDCEAVLCRGMGQGAYNSMQIHGIKPVVTDIANIDAAALAYAAGEIVNHVDRLH